MFGKQRSWIALASYYWVICCFMYGSFCPYFFSVQEIFVQYILQSSAHWNSVVNFFINPTFAANKGPKIFYICTCSKSHPACFMAWYCSLCRTTTVLVLIVVLFIVIFMFLYTFQKQEFPTAVHDVHQSIKSKPSFCTSWKRTGQQNKQPPLTPPTLSQNQLLQLCKATGIPQRSKWTENFIPTY